MKAAIITLGALMIAANAFAQTCSSPLPIPRFGSTSGDTCTSGNPFPSYPGGIPSPHNDVVYSFRLQQDNIGVITVRGSASLPAPGWVVLDACDPVHANIIASGSNNNGTATAAPFNLDPGVIYYLVITTDPGAGQPNNTCGPYTATIDVPVELQSFIIE